MLKASSRSCSALCFRTSLSRRWQSSDRAISHLPQLKQSAMAANYNPAHTEAGWYDWWQLNGCFQPKLDDSQPFCMVLPPPNVTGALHIGHALTVSIEDAICRWKRMQGYDVLWIPGLDHAGIATQSVVERQLQKTSNVTRHDLGREKFVEQVWAWYEQYGGRINSQLKRLGASLDWNQHTFTMDEVRSAAVQEAFIQMFNDKLIYRGSRFVNWCPHLRTAISDIEVDVKQLSGETELQLPSGKQKFGQMHTFGYPLEEPVGGTDVLWVSTTRLETMLGDVGVAVHPDDKYAHLIGKRVRHPVHNTLLPIVADSELVDPSLGTGAVKLTPAHDENDYLCALRHNLPIECLLNDDGTINHHGGSEFEGMDRFSARAKLVTMLDSLGLYKGAVSHSMALAVCSRSGDVLEPMLKPQWFVACEQLAKKAKAAVETGDLDLLPSVFHDTWTKWLENTHDWCISRQLWWGHRIPAYRVLFADSEDEVWLAAASKEAALEQVQAQYPQRSVESIVQDEDVLDTWFSSALFPLSALGWPCGSDPQTRMTPALTKFYPLTIMETGHDILFFWVARMAMLSTYLSDTLPFQTIALHPIVRDKSGRKMSKSLGNVIDPISVIDGRSLADMLEDLQRSNLPVNEVNTALKNLKKEYSDGIPACGSDALRYALAAVSTQDHFMNMDTQHVVQAKLFANKLWNAVRYCLTQIESLHSECEHISPLEATPNALGVASLPLDRFADNLTCHDKWILSRLATCVSMYEGSMSSCKVGLAASAVRWFIQADFCDVYIEASKFYMTESDTPSRQRTAAVLSFCIDAALRLLHPFMPFVTEELWQRLHYLGLDGNGHCTHPALPKSIMLALPPSSTMIHDFTGSFSPKGVNVGHFSDSKLEEQMQEVLQCMTAARSLRKLAAEAFGMNAKDASISVICECPQLLSMLQDLEQLMSKQLKCENLTVLTSAPVAQQHILRTAVSNNTTVLLPIAMSAQAVNKLEAEIRRLQKKIAKLDATINRLHKLTTGDAATLMEQAAFDAAQEKLERARSEHAAATATLIQLEAVRD